MAAAGAPWQLECEDVEQRCGYLLTSGLWSDCTFVVGSETSQEVVPAHKLVLAMASPVFEAMFYGGLSEDNEPVVPISDVPPEVFRALLQYIYTGNISIDSCSLACNLWYGAKKYMLPHLVQKCLSYICSVLSPSNVCKTYEFARLFDEKTLTDTCIKIICTNTKEVLNDDSFEDVEVKTVITVCSLDHLTVDSELDLFHAVARYAEAQQRRQGQISPSADGEAPLEELSDKVLPSAGSSSQTSPAVEQHSKTEETPSEPTADKENLKEEEPSIRAALQKIRFLSLSSSQFAEGPARSNLLTKDESFALFMNIASKDCPVPMPTGFSECRERRQPRSDWVNKGPFAKPRPAPSTESRGVAATQLLTLDEIVRGLSSSNEETLEQAARAARHMTCADADGTSENLTQLIAAGVIPALVAVLHHSRTVVKHDAASALANIGCGGKHAMVLVDGGAVPVLVGLLDFNYGIVAEQAARVLGIIARGGETARDAVVNARAHSKLQTLMRPSTPSALLGAYVHTYRMICQKETCSDWSQSTFEHLSPAVPKILDLLELTDERVLVEACGVLQNLAGGAAKFNSQLFTHKFVNYKNGKVVVVSSRFATLLTALLQPAAATRVQTAALAAVESMLGTTTAFLRDQFLGAGCLNHIIHFLKSENHSHVKKAVQITGYIMLGSSENIQLALDAGILDALGPALTEGDDECKLHAVLAIFNICDRGTPAQLHVLADSAALEPYCWLLAAGGSICGEVLCGLTNLLKKVDQNSKAELIVKLREIGVPQLLINLQRDGDGHINVKLATNLLQSYFNNDQ